MHLTDISLKAIKPPETGQRDYFDDAFSGFGLRISQGGTRTFFLLVGRAAQRRRFNLGRCVAQGGSVDAKPEAADRGR